MNNKVVAMILAGGKGTRLEGLTRKNAKPAVGFAAKYRIIDFPLSNCAYSGINTVGVLTQFESTQLNSYLGNGEKWGFNGLHSVLDPLPPRLTEEGGNFYLGTADAITQNLDWIKTQKADYVVILSGDHIYAMDYMKMVNLHIQSEAEITVAAIEVDKKEATRFGIIETNNDDQIVGFEEKPKNPKSNLASMGVYCFSFKTLNKYLLADKKDSSSEHDFGKNIVPKILNDGLKVMAYRFKGYWRDVGTLASLHQANMDLLDTSNKLMQDFYNRTIKIFSEDTYSVPQYIGPSGSITNSIANQGAIILGSATRCVISSEAIIREGARCESCVIMAGAEIGANAFIRNAIIAPNAKVKEGTVIDSKDVILME